MGQVNNHISSSDISVYLLAENRLLRESLAHLLQKRAGIRVVGISPYAESPVEQIAATDCEVLLMDSLPRAPQTIFLHRLCKQLPRIKIVLFGMNEDPDVFLRSVYLGVSGYVLKDASAGEIVAAVRCVAQGEAACPPRLWMTLIQHLSHESRRKPRSTEHLGSARCSLTHRQFQLLDLVEKGMTNKEIAADLNLSEFTVKNHMRRIMRQLDAGDRYEAVDVIRANGIPPNA
jgi:DNA-binding NarL/FixJ family response regulator